MATTPDVERSLALAPEPTTDATARIARRLTDLRAVAASVGLVLYLFLRVAYSDFYAPFGLSPEDLGFGYVDLLAQSAAGVAAVTALALVSVAVVPMGLGTLAMARARVAKLVVAFAAMLVGYVGVEQHWVIGWPVTLVAFGWLAGDGIALLRSGLRSEFVLVGDAVRWLSRTALAALALAVVGFAGYLLLDEAATDARAVARGVPAAPRLWGVPVAAWHARAARVSWLRTPSDSDLRRLSGRCLMYLGESDGTAYLVRPGARHPDTFRLPAGDVVVRVLPGRGCR